MLRGWGMNAVDVKKPLGFRFGALCSYVEDFLMFQTTHLVVVVRRLRPRLARSTH